MVTNVYAYWLTAFFAIEFSGSCVYYVCKIFRETTISYPPDTHTRSCTYLGVRSVGFSDNFEKVINEWSLPALF